MKRKMLWCLFLCGIIFSIQGALPAFTTVRSELMVQRAGEPTESLRNTIMRNGSGDFRYEYRQMIAPHYSEMYPDLNARRTMMLPSTEVSVWQSSF